MEEQTRTALAGIAGDDRSGATDILLRVVDLLLAAPAGARAGIAAAAVAAQPSMAGLLNLEAAVLDPRTTDRSLQTFRERVRRAPAAIARHGVPVLLLGARVDRAGRPLVRLVTCSSSSAVERTIVELAGAAAVHVSCAEGRPALEGTALAARLASRGIAVDLHTDAGISSAVPGADALLLGADAVGQTQFINKVGSGALAAYATYAGVPAYLLAGREKLLSDSLFARLVIRDETQGRPQSGSATLRMPYFEASPRSLISMLISDAGAM